MAQMAARCTAAVLALAASLAHADFRSALKDYRDGHYDSARAQFQALAELGDASSQFNLGAMALSGQGGPKDLASAVGWFTAAADNGNRDLPADRLAAMQARLAAEERKRADELAARYGRDGLSKTVLPIPRTSSQCRDVVPAKILSTPDVRGDYPKSGELADRNGLVIVQLTVGVDGIGRDPEVLMAVPNTDFSAAAVRILMQARFRPATRTGLPIESKVALKVKFTMDNGGYLWNSTALKSIREAARIGEPSAQYVVGLAATLDTTLGITDTQAHDLLVAAAQGGHPHAQYWAASRFLDLNGCTSERQKYRPWLRAAAAADDASAQLALARELLDGAPSAAHVLEAKGLLAQAAKSDDFYVMKHLIAILASSVLENIRDPATAITVARRLQRSPIDADPQMFEALALAYAANNEYRDAATKQQIAIKKAAALQWNTEAMQQRYDAYQHSRPWNGDVFAVSAVSAMQ